MFGLDGLLSAILSSLQDVFTASLVEFITGLLTGLFPTT